MNGMKYESGPSGGLASYLDDNEWVAEQKLDGVRVMAHVTNDRIRFQGVGGSVITFAAAAQHFGHLTRELACVPEGTVLDGELILETGVLWLFDLPYMPNQVKPENGLDDRRFVLEHLVRLIDGEHVKLVPQASTRAMKQLLWERTIAEGAEGVVMKRLAAPYAIGRRTRDVLKFKHTKTIDVVVTARNVGGTNAQLSLVRDGELVVIGACSMIGKPDLQVGDCAEVEFLYIADPAAPSLYQPRLVRARPDKSMAECEWRQVEGCFTSRAVVTI